MNIVPSIGREIGVVLVICNVTAREILLEYECYEHDQHKEMISFHVDSHASRGGRVAVSIFLVIGVSGNAIVLNNDERVWHHD